jgi:hypothetical protein
LQRERLERSGEKGSGEAFNFDPRERGEKSYGTREGVDDAETVLKDLEVG